MALGYPRVSVRTIRQEGARNAAPTTIRTIRLDYFLLGDRNVMFYRVPAIL